MQYLLCTFFYLSNYLTITNNMMFYLPFSYKLTKLQWPWIHYYSLLSWSCWYSRPCQGAVNLYHAVLSTMMARYLHTQYLSLSLSLSLSFSHTHKKTCVHTRTHLHFMYSYTSKSDMFVYAVESFPFEYPAHCRNVSSLANQRNHFCLLVQKMELLLICWWLLRT